MNEKVKLYEKCFKRIGMTVFEKDGMKKGTITSFTIEDNPDGTFCVNYLVMFDLGNGFCRVQPIHESKLVLMKGSEL
ncbi:hypothetical protein PDQ75_25125 [Bacillus cereus group sp. Bc015]|uniref:hypothetical protein n=1 Tax=Bacillus cereus group sp. Bc015 TaxID=3018123 RepID=UPI0022E0E697|nr:hypothetical protein [Bacillus cereus group sp. Bc015]MDA2738440.1 hypothetical protein [Bacillus cereus group sp. Bc015]